MRTTLPPDRSQWSELWQSAYRILEQRIFPTQLSAWIQPLEIGETSSDGQAVKVKLLTNADFSAQWVKDHYLNDIEAAFSQVTGLPCQVTIDVRAGEPLILTEPETPTQIQKNELLVPTREEFASPSGRSSLGVIEERYTFESYIKGASNELAYASSFAVAQQPGRQYNPLFLYSQPGLGKTHLLHAVGNHLLQKNPGIRVAYLSAEQFVNELIEAIQHNRMAKFREKYRESFDCILIDDIQFIAGKEKTEEEFFHTFNALYSSKRQIVVTSDRPPKEIKGLQDRIRTRFEWGLIVDIQPPEIETRIAILKAKAERDDIYLPEDVATFLASHIKTNVRELEGVLVSLKAQVSLTGAEISLEMAKQTLRLNLPEEGSAMTAESILQAVARHFHLRIQDLKSTSRSQQVAFPRQIGMYLIRKYTGLQYKEIGAHFGGKDHTTILHACKKIEAALLHDEQTQEIVRAVQNLL